MPIYEYECPVCGDKFELRRDINESDDGISCAKCGAKKPRRIMSLFSLGSSRKACSPDRST